MRLVHESTAGTRTLATDVETADSLFAQVKGLMGRSSVPEDYALVFPVRRDPVAVAVDRLPLFGRLVDPDQHGVHMLFVRTPIDVVWVEDERVVQTRTLQPWTGTGTARADTLVELAPGVASGVEAGDTVRVVGDGDSAGSAKNAADSADDGADPTL